jgi:purine-binding chemotaxis protein CheW
MMNTLHIILTVGGAEYAIAASDVMQMESYSGATPVPGAPPYVAGLVQIRQQVLPVVDLRARFGLPSIEPTLDSRVVVVQVGARRVGILVDRAREVQDIAPEQLRPPPDLVSTHSAGFVSAVAQLGRDRIVMLLDPPRLVGEEPVHA